MVVGHDFEPKILGFVCNWCCYAGADLAGVSRYQYPPNMKLIRVMCSGRVDPKFIFRAFSRGVDGVLIGGCWPGECHYVTEGNYDAEKITNRSKKLLEHIEVNPERLRLEWVSASEGIRFAEIVSDFTSKLKELGPIGIGEGMDESELKSKLEAAENYVRKKLITYYINPEKCQACMICLRKCPVEAIIGGKKQLHVINQEKCIGCGICSQACPPRFGAVEEILDEAVPQPIPEGARTIAREG